MRMNGSNSNAVDVCFRATFADVALVLQRVMRESPLCELSQSRQRDLELVLAECLNNVAEHAYSHTDLGEVRLLIARQQDMICVEIADHGKEFPKSLLADSPVAETTAEGGRGWLLIRSLCNSITYQRHRGTNRLKLAFLSSD